MFRSLISYYIGSPELNSKTRKYIDISSSLFYINDKNDNQEKLATQGTKDEEKQNKTTTQYVGHHYTQTNTNNTNKT